MSRFSLDAAQCRNYDLSSRREWLLTNGLGGYAMGTASGANQRRYHGLLVAAVEPPSTRMVLLANVECEVIAGGQPIGLSTNQYQGAVHPDGYQYLEHFSIGKTATWRYRAEGLQLERVVAVHPGVNAVDVIYRNTGNRSFELVLRPLVAHKFYHDNFRVVENYPDGLVFPKNRTIISNNGVDLVLRHEGAKRIPTVGWYYRFEYQREIERGLDPRDDVFCPCELHYELSPGEEICLVAGLGEAPKPLTQLPVEPASATLGDQLRGAAEHYLVKTQSRTTIIAGYPWFTDWGRDTMIALPGLLLHTGHVAEARRIILDYASQMKQGLIPNRFVENGEETEYNTVDATLWFANAIYRTLEVEWDAKFAAKSMTALEKVYKNHVKGTLYGIKVDPVDGLLTQGEAGVQLTWMDAKVGDWVVTPRHGKPVEINGLWINALRVMQWLADRLEKPSAAYVTSAELAESNFDAKFWRDHVGYYLDTADPDDASLRPNQLIAMSLPYGPARGPHAVKALEAIQRELVTPVGLRTLAPNCPGYQGRYKGNLADLDAAYHQGTVWPWLIGPYVTALVRLTGDTAEARRILRNAREMLAECGLGGIAEVYDGDEPRSPSGCPWQAWSVGEWLRAWVEDVGGR